MKISIVIPSFNQAAYLEECLRSIFAQEHAAREIIVVDGGSTDGSVAILKKYSAQLASWVSEKDRGQTDALNKGLKRITGEVWMYLNSDDALTPGALGVVARAFADPQVQWLSGAGEIWRDGRVTGQLVPQPAHSRADYLRPWARPGRFVFPFSGACFLRRGLYDRFGEFDATFHYSMDMEYYTRLALRGGVPQTFVPQVLGRWRWHEASKTHLAGQKYGFLRDEIRIAERYVDCLDRDERALVLRDLRAQRNWLALRLAADLSAPEMQPTPFGRLLRAAARRPQLVGFRPWWGAVRRTLQARPATAN
ncbi:MAG TPA: glycosyltransferase family 2 protein [Opitutaceae bacterium]|nr:glycosyltransferase family 2 protein [Opitutaceae bacterium]